MPYVSPHVPSACAQGTPHRTKYGSQTVSTVSDSSPTMADRLFSPTGPPLKLVTMAFSTAISKRSRPSVSIWYNAKASLTSFGCTVSRSCHDGPIPYATKQSVGDTRRTPRTHGKLVGSTVLEADAKHSRRSFDKLFKLLMRIKVEMRGETETSPQRRRQHAFTSGGTNHCKPRQSKRDGGSAPVLCLPSRQHENPP